MSCRNCEKRYPGCHSSCYEYQLEKAKEEKRKEIIAKNRNAEANYLGFVCNSSNYGNSRK